VTPDTEPVTNLRKNNVGCTFGFWPGTTATSL